MIEQINNAVFSLELALWTVLAIWSKPYRQCGMA